MADYWTITSLSTQGGIGKDALRDAFSTEYTMPTGQNGAKAANYISSASGDHIPTWATPASIVYTYHLSFDGKMSFYFSTADAGACTQDGSAGAQALRLNFPYAQPASIAAASNLYFQAGVAVTNTVREDAYLQLARNATYCNIWRFIAGTGFSSLQEVHTGDAAGDDLEFAGTIQIF